MHPFTTPRLRRVDEVDAEFLTFELTPQQLARLPKGKTIVFRKSTHPKKGKGYRQFVSRAEYTSSEPGKRGRAVAIATKLLGVIWDDDPEWIYETNKAKSSIKARRVAAERRTTAAPKASDDPALRIFEAPVAAGPSSRIVEDVPALLFSNAALLCAARGLTDPQSVADCWNENIPRLRELLPAHAFMSLTPEAVRRIYASMADTRRFLRRRLSTQGTPQVSGPAPHLCLRRGIEPHGHDAQLGRPRRRRGTVRPHDDPLRSRRLGVNRRPHLLPQRRRFLGDARRGAHRSAARAADHEKTRPLSSCRR